MIQIAVVFGENASHLMRGYFLGACGGYLVQIVRTKAHGHHASSKDLSRSLEEALVWV